MPRDILTWPTKVAKGRIAAHFTVYGDPVPKGRPRFGGGHVYTPQETVVAEQRVLLAYRESDWTKFPKTTRLGIRVWIFRKDYKTRDWDNIVKLIQDALNGEAFHDDEQIDEAIVQRPRERATCPRAEILIYKLTGRE